MERVLRSAQMAEITLLPVRHHSPACAWHVHKMIQLLKPSLILIEGPNNANSLIPVMVNEDTRAPFAIYYSYHDKAQRLSEKAAHYKCYYPFLDYSPELVALRTAKETGVPALFIDLSYADILMASKDGQGMRSEQEKNNYSDDYLLSRNQFWERLCEQTNLRSFDEFWEKYFELNGLAESSDLWFSHLLDYCKMVRENTPLEVLEGEGSLAREAYMAQQIAKAAHEYGPQAKILVVTGGFHTPAIQKLLEEYVSNKENMPKTVEQIATDNQGVYLLPYSMEATDALNGYASGMPYPGFYQKVWEELEKNNEIESKLPSRTDCRVAGRMAIHTMEVEDFHSKLPSRTDCHMAIHTMEVEDFVYEEAVLAMLAQTGHDLRKKDEQLSVYDEICALTMARGLAALRGKIQPGAYELLDAALSSLVKGEYSLATELPIRLLQERMTGNAKGKLCHKADVPPIFQDFEQQCALLRIKPDSTLETEITLSVFSNKKHRQISMFFNRLLFLKAPFAQRIKGPNLQLKKDRNLIREVWRYKWSVEVAAALIDVSVYGSTIQEAAQILVKKELEKVNNARNSVWLLTRVFEMGLVDRIVPVYEQVEETILEDTDFYSLADALESLLMLEELRGLYQSELEFGQLVLLTIRKLVVLLPSMTQVKEESVTSCMQALKLIYQVTGKKNNDAFEQEREPFFDALSVMQADPQIHPGLDGCIHGILYGSGRQKSSVVEQACKGYMKGTKEQMMKTAAFFRGLFYTARDFVFVQKQFLQALDTFFAEVDKEEFMELLPELRMAFAYFTPMEIDQIAQEAAALHGKDKDSLMQAQAVLPDWYAYGNKLDHYGKEKIWQASRKH